MIGIIHYEIGNLRSVQRALEKVGTSTTWVRHQEQLEGINGLVLPGVGAFGDCMKAFRATGLEASVRNWIQQDRPFLGICVGYQMLFTGSKESPDVKGLGIFSGHVVQFDAQASSLKVPHIGWNTAQKTPTATRSPFLANLPDSSFFYFVHSYYPHLAKEEKEIEALTTNYGVTFPSAITRGNLLACQFHPEKSQQHGLQLLENFVTLAHQKTPASSL